MKMPPGSLGAKAVDVDDGMGERSWVRRGWDDDSC